LSTGESSPLRLRSSEPDRDETPAMAIRSVLREIFSLCRLIFSSLAASRSIRRAVSRSSLRASFSRRDCSFSWRLQNLGIYLAFSKINDIEPKTKLDGVAME